MRRVWPPPPGCDVVGRCAEGCGGDEATWLWLRFRLCAVAFESDSDEVDASSGAVESPGEGVHTGCDRVLRRRVPSSGDSMGDEGTYSEPGGV